MTVVARASSVRTVAPSARSLMTSAELGNYGERYAYFELIRQGYFVEFARSGTDLLVEDWRVDVKTARVGAGGWQFCIRRVDDAGHILTDFRWSDYLLLIALDGRLNVPFVVPVDVVEARPVRTVIRMRSLNGGWLAAYRQEWGAVRFGGVSCGG